MITIEINKENPEKSYNQILEELQRYPPTKVKVIYDNGRVENRRLSLYSENSEQIFLYGRRKRKWGLLLGPSDYRMNNWKTVKITETLPKNVKWERSWQRVLGMLEESGLWKNEVEKIKIILDIGYDKLQQARKEDWKKYPELNYEEQREKRIQEIKKIDSRLVEKSKDTETEYTISNFWLYSMPAKIKTMYWGKPYRANKIKENIANSLKNKVECHEYQNGAWINYYDVTFGYRPEYNRAWYNEEYRNCGNGHYYIALNATHALFLEDD